MRWAARWLSALLVAGAFVPAWAMTPAAVVVEIATGAADEALAPCRDLRLRRGEIQIAEEAARWLESRKGKRAGWHAPRRLRRLEDVRFVLLLRSPGACEIALGDGTKGEIPFPWNGSLPFRTWRVNADGIHFFGPLETSLAAGRLETLPVPFTSGPPLRLYHHGRLEIYRGLSVLRARPVGPDDAVSIHLEGPGDEARFLFRADGNGTLIVERTPGNMPNLGMLIGSGERDLQPRGMMEVKAGKAAWIDFRYVGAEPLDLDVGFLFTRDAAVTCKLEIASAGPGQYRAAVILHNRNDAPVSIHRPSAGTVDWYAGDRVIAAARLARMPERMLVEAGRSVRYETVLFPPDGLQPTRAKVHTGMGTGELLCAGAAVQR